MRIERDIAGSGSSLMIFLALEPRRSMSTAIELFYGPVRRPSACRNQTGQNRGRAAGRRGIVPSG